MKKILLLHPPRLLQRTYGGFFASFNLIRHNRGVDRLPGVTPPTEVALLASVLCKEYTVEVLDANALNMLSREVCRYIRNSAPDVVIIRAGDSTFLDDILYYYFAEGTGSTAIVWENHLSSLYAERMMKEFGIKRLLGGDPEEIIFKMLASGDEGYFYGAPCAIDTLPAVRLDLLPVKRYIYDNRRTWFIEQSRGCGWGRCTFCMRSRSGENSLSFRSLDTIESELLAAQTKGVEHIFFWGDDLNSNRERLFALCDVMSRFTFSWECWMRVSGADTTVLQACRNSGCERITFGVESGDQLVLDKLDKGTTIDEVHTAFRNCREIGIGAVASLFIGSPYETLRSLKKTWHCIRRLQPEQLLVSCYRPFVNTPLFEIATKEKLVEEDLFEKTIHDGFFGGEPFIRSYTLSKKTLSRWYRRFSLLATWLSIKNYLVQPAKWPYAVQQFLLKIIREQ